MKAYKNLIHIFSLICLFSLLLSLTNCKHDEIPVINLKTYEVADIISNSATLEGEVISDGGLAIKTKGICISTYKNPMPIDGQIIDGGTNNRIKVIADNLKGTTQYYYRAFAVTEVGVFFGEELSFTTGSFLARIDNTANITEITELSALTGGALLDAGGEITTCGVCWSTQPQPTINDDKTEDLKASKPSEYTSLLKDLTPNTTYYVRAYASNSKGTIYADEKSFQTLIMPWTQKANFGGDGRSGAVAFSINDKGYVGLGVMWEGYSPSTPTYYKDFWEYNPITNVWTQIANYPAKGRHKAMACAINGKGYVGGGEYNYSDDGGYSYYTNFMYDFYEYNPELNNWLKKHNISEGYGDYGISGGVCLPINNKGYFFFFRADAGYNNLVLEYNPTTDTWIRKQDFPGPKRGDGVGFSLGDKGYVGLGHGNNYGTVFNDFWEYNPTDDSWTQKKDFPGSTRSFSTGFNIDNVGYIILGEDGVSGYTNEFWEYNQESNAWRQRFDFKGATRTEACSFTINGKAYVGTGFINQALGSKNYVNDFWEYDPTEDSAK